MCNRLSPVQLSLPWGLSRGTDRGLGKLIAEVQNCLSIENEFHVYVGILLVSGVAKAFFL